MKKLIGILVLSFLLTGCFGQKEPEITGEDLPIEVVESEEIVNPEDDLESVNETEGEVEEIETEEVETEEVENEDSLTPEELTRGSIQDETIRSNIENDPEAKIVEQETVVIPTAPVVEETAEVSDEKIQQDLLDGINEVSDEITDKVADDILDGIFENIESDEL